MAETDPALTLPPWYASRTLWVLLATKTIFLLNILGVTFDPDFANTLGNFLADGAVVAGLIITALMHRKSKKLLTEKANTVIATVEASK